MNSHFQEAREAERITLEGRDNKHRRRIWLTDEEFTTTNTAFTSPWIDTNRSPDTCYINTVTQRVVPAADADKYFDSISIGVPAQIMPPADKVDTWFASSPAGPTYSSPSRPNTRDTALTSLIDDESQLSKHEMGDNLLDPPASGSAIRDLDDEHRPPPTLTDANALAPGVSNAHQSRPSISQLDTRDAFFDSVPKGPSQFSISRWNAGAPAFDPWSSARGPTPASSWHQKETPSGPSKHAVHL